MSRFLREQKLQNRLHSMLLVAALAALLAMVGSLLAGKWGLITALALAVVAALIGPRVSPALILKMYRARRMGPREAPELNHLVRQVAHRAGLAKELPLYYVPSRMLNAFAVGSGDHASIALTDGVLRHLNEREIAAVVAHEISHVVNRDLHVMALADVFSRLTSAFSRIGVLGLILTTPWLSIQGWLSWFLAFLLLAAAPGFSALIQLALSRAREFHADLGAVELTGDPLALASALRKLDRLQPDHRLRRVLFPQGEPQAPGILRTHPATGERVRRLLELAAPETPPEALRHPRQRMPAAVYPRIARAPRYHAWSGLWY